MCTLNSLSRCATLNKDKIWKVSLLIQSQSLYLNAAFNCCLVDKNSNVCQDYLVMRLLQVDKLEEETKSLLAKVPAAMVMSPLEEKVSSWQ